MPEIVGWGDKQAFIHEVASLFPGKCRREDFGISDSAISSLYFAMVHQSEDIESVRTQFMAKFHELFDD